MIKYNIYFFDSKEVDSEIINLYAEIFKVEATTILEKWFYKKEISPAAIIARTEKDEMVGLLSGVIMDYKFTDGEIHKFGLPAGLMVKSEYRGQNIAAELWKNMDQYFRKLDCKFWIAFPNENAIKVYLSKLNTKLISTYSFASIYTLDECIYTYTKKKRTTINLTSTSKSSPVRDEAYMEWRFSGEKYMHFENSKGTVFVVTKFQDKIDILMWSEKATKEELEDFATYLKTTESVKKISTWDCKHYLDEYPKEGKKQYLVAKAIDENLELSEIENWDMYMGDCEAY